MSLSPSSLAVFIKPGSNIYLDKSYKVIMYASNTARRYGSLYTQLSNTYIFYPSVTNNYNGYQSNITSNLLPDTLYYSTAATQNIFNSPTFYGPSVDSRSNSNINFKYKRTLLPDPPVYIDSVVFNNANSIYPNYGISANFLTNGMGSNVIYTYNSGAINFNIINGRPIGIHTSNNTGSTTSNIMKIITQCNSINDINYNMGGFTHASNNSNISGTYTIVNISNIRDKYNESNYTGFYRIFNTSISYIGPPSTGPIQLKYIQQFYDNSIKSNTISQFYADNLNSLPSVTINNSNITSIFTPSVTYVTGIPSFNNLLTFDGIIIDHLYTNFFPTGEIIKFTFTTSQSLRAIKNSTSMDINNLTIYNVGGAQISIGNSANVADTSVYLNNFIITLSNNLYTPAITLEPYLTIEVKNIIGTYTLTSNLCDILNILSNSIYWDLPSIDVINNTQEATTMYGARVLAGYDSSPDGTWKAEYYGDYFETIYNLISFSGDTVFDNTIDLTSRDYSNYNYELPLFNGYFQTYSYSNGVLGIDPYIDYKKYNNFGISYPNYKHLVTNVPNINMVFRYICFKYAIPPQSIRNNGICMIQFINNNFTMNTTNNIIGYVNNINYYLIKYKIITFDGTETSWISLQSYAPLANMDFYTRSISTGALTSTPFIDNATNLYTQSSSNRVFLIPPNIENVGFYMYIRVGIPKDRSAAFQYISSCFNFTT